METAGYLFIKTGNKWRRGYFQVNRGFLHSQFNSKDEPKEMANLLVCTVRLADSRDADRRFCFEVVSPNERLIFQAENEEILQHWIQIIQNSIAHALNYNRPNLKKSGIHPQEQDAMCSSNSFLAQLRTAEMNCFCADCGEESKFFFVLGRTFCIESSHFSIHKWTFEFSRNLNLTRNLERTVVN